MRVHGMARSPHFLGGTTLVIAATWIYSLGMPAALAKLVPAWPESSVRIVAAGRAAVEEFAGRQSWLSFSQKNFADKKFDV